MSLPALPFRTIALNTGAVALVDEADFEVVSAYCWQASSGKTTYAQRCGFDAFLERKTTILLHRFILGALPGQIVDHANRNSLDNRRANLRFCDHSQNQTNKVINSDAPFRGVRKSPGCKNFIARIRFRGERFHLGSFDNPEDAAVEYDRAARKLFGDFAVVNFPDRIPA